MRPTFSCPSPISRPGKNALTFAQLLAIQQSMRDTLGTVAGITQNLKSSLDGSLDAEIP
jgi:hypothetical protein